MKDTELKILTIIRKHFLNGIRDDFIDTTKVFRIFSRKSATEKISRKFVADTIRANGVETNGRFYFLSEKDRARLLFCFTEIIEQHDIAYYSTVYEKHADFFMRMHIFSPTVLKGILSESTCELFFFDDFCATSKLTCLDHEVSKFFVTTRKALSLKDLQSRLTYVPSEKISAVLTNEKKFLHMDNDKFFLLDNVLFEEDEIRQVKQQLTSRLEQNELAEDEEFDLPVNFALNPEVSQPTLRRLIRDKFLSDLFDRRNSGASHKINPLIVNAQPSKKNLQDFLLSRDEVTLRELSIFVKDTYRNSTACLLSALSEPLKVMTRVSKNLFVKSALIEFNVNETDEALTPFVQNKIIPIRAVTSFTGFPPVANYSWNLFMLASFLQKYSQNFSYSSPTAVCSDVGAVYPSSLHFETYLDVQVAAFNQAQLPLEKNVVGNFLVSQGYRARRLTRVTDQIFSRIQSGLHMSRI